MGQESTIRVLTLASEFNLAQIIRQKRVRGEALEIYQVTSHHQFLESVQNFQPDLIVAEAKGMHDFSLCDLLRETSQGSSTISVVIVGEDGEDGRDALFWMERGAADYLPFSQIDSLPWALSRLRREQECANRERVLEGQVERLQDAVVENQKLMTVGRLAASIAHEINNPLESVTNLLYLLRGDQALSQSSTEYIDLAEREMERVSQIAKQTLSYYREADGPTKVKPEELLEEVVSLYSRRISERGLTIARSYQSDQAIFVLPGEMRQVLSNLITNAIEATADGGRLTLRVRKARRWSGEGGNGVRIVIADSGSGIAAEIRKRLGQLFYTTKGQSGTGLGLWVSRAIVKRYGGDIRIYSSTARERHGTVFSVFIPTNPRSQSLGLVAGPKHSGGGGHGMRETRRVGNSANDHSTEGGIRGYRSEKAALVAS